ncbi:hypothetical protein AGMMS50262_12280 [Bacteroidia bacterium]|nr:hypothetical protein AGMMS50262_12280 [Bacteroidia bacterium]
MLEIITPENSEKWNAVVQSMKEYDFYHLAEYHRLDTTGKALLFSFQHETEAFAWPVILRDIEGTDYKDITSVYGYAGALANVKKPSKQAIHLFQETIKAYFTENRVVSAFARLHPLFKNQTQLLNDWGEMAEVNITVGIDLTLPEAKQKSQYAHSLRNDINRLEKEGVQIRQAKTKEEIDVFVQIYWENMRRVNASENYFFPTEYFYDFLATIPSHLFLVYYKGKAMAGSIFTICNGIIQTHLSATKDEYLVLSPMKYVWDKIRTFGVEEKAKYIHLGGGYGGKNDTLFEFKSQFSKHRFIFKIWKYIHNQAVYEQLAANKLKEKKSSSSFFPLYRE